MNIALGNTDNHARNTAISKYPNGIIALSPLYDFAPMILDEQGIARTCRWSQGEHAGFPEWGKIAEVISQQFSDFQIDTNELRQWFFDFAKITEQLTDMMQQANVDADLIERLSVRISETTQALKGAKSHG